MKTKVIFFLLAVICSSMLFSQKSVADKFFDKYAYIKASELYQAAVTKGDSSKHVLTRIGDCYYNNSNSEKAALWYEKAVNKYPNINPVYKFKYAQSLKSLGQYDKAKELIINLKSGHNKEATQLIKDNPGIFNELSNAEEKYIKFDNLDSNSEYSEFGGYEHQGKFYFAAAKSGDKIYEWNGEPYLDIYVADVSNSDGNKSITNETLLPSDGINTPYHEATIAITNDGKTLYFTRDNLTKKEKIAYNKGGTSHLNIYKATLDNDTWKNIEELPFNQETSSTGHPALSPDNKTLYFVSDREGGHGLTDIYSVSILDDGTYGTVKNLGDKINTSGREMFPFVAKDSTLYFSSDGHINLGLLDVFKSNIIKDKNASAENLGAPYNSGYDDFAFYIDTDDDTGFVSSNRGDGKGGDDIYKFKVFDCMQHVTGTVFNKLTKEPIDMATVKLIDSNGKIIEETQTDANGKYNFDLDCEKKYSLIATKLDHRDDTKDFETNKEHDVTQTIDLELIPLIIDNEIVINPIFFDYDKSNIRPDAAYELENIVTVMNNHPKMIIKIESHTDSRGKDAYNEKLSDRRAKSTRDYIISKDIAYNRIESAIGFGEKQLVNECSNGV
ncbi:MAG: OmpA family protein, partial [Oceanihabitans sp.]